MGLNTCLQITEVKVQNIKAIIFDMDGLMFDSERLSMDCAKKVASDWGFILDDDFINTLYGKRGSDKKEMYKDKFGDNFDFDLFYKAYVGLKMDIIKRGELGIKKGLLNLLEFLTENNYPMAIVSGNKQSSVEIYLQSSNIDKNLFSTIVGGERVSKGKPDPEGFLTACKELGFAPTQVLILEDAKPGIIAAHRAGCKSAFIQDIMPADDECKKLYDKEFEDLDQVKDFLKQILCAVH